MCSEPRLRWSRDPTSTVVTSLADPQLKEPYAVASFRARVLAQVKAIFTPKRSHSSAWGVLKRETWAQTHRKCPLMVVVFGCGHKTRNAEDTGHHARLRGGMAGVLDLGGRAPIP